MNSWTRTWLHSTILFILILSLATISARAQGQETVKFEAITSSDEPFAGLTVNLTAQSETHSLITGRMGEAEFELPPDEYTLNLRFQDTDVPHDLVDFEPSDSVTQDWKVMVTEGDDRVITIELSEDFNMDSDDDGSFDWWELANGRDPLVKDGGLTFIDGEDPLNEAGPIDPDEPEGLDYRMMIVVVVITLVCAALAYSKIRRDKILEHVTRENIYNHIKEQPGTHLRGIKNELGLSMGVLNHHLSRLEQEELIRSKTERQYKRFYPYYFTSKDSPLLSSAQKAVYNTIVENPGVTPPKAGILLGRSKRSIYNHIKALEEMGLIRTKKDGKHLRCYINDTT